MRIGQFNCYLWNKSFLAKAYNSVSNALISSILRFCSDRKTFIVELETVELCCSNGIANRKLNVSSNTYWDILRKKNIRKI